MPATVSPIHTQPPSADKDSESTSSASPEASQSRATPNFSRPLPRSPTGTAPPGNASPPPAGRVTTSGLGFSRPLPSIPDAPSYKSQEYTHGGRGSGLGMRIIDDRDPDDDFVIPGPALRQHQSRSPVVSYEEDGRTSSAATDSELLYASAPSTPLHAPLQLEQETDIGLSSPSGSQVTHGATRRATVAASGARRDHGEGSLTPRRAFTTDNYSRAHSQQETPVPQLPKTPQNFQHRSAHDVQEAHEQSDGMDPHSRKLLEQFDDDTPSFPEPFLPGQTTDTPHFPEPQPHPPPLVLGLPISDSQIPSSPQSDETVTMPTTSFAFPLPPPIQKGHESTWKSYASSSLDGGSTFGDHLVSSDTSQHRPLPTSVIAGTNLEFEPLQSPHEQTISRSSPTPHAGTPRYVYDSLTNAPQELPHTHTHRPLPPFPPVSTSQGRIGSLYRDEGHGYVGHETDDKAPLSVAGISSVTPLRIAKHTQAPSSTTPIPPGAAAPIPLASSSSGDVNRTRESPSAKPAALPVSIPPSSQKQQSPSSRGNRGDAAELVSGSSDVVGIASAKGGIPSGTQNIGSGVQSSTSSGSPAHTRPGPSPGTIAPSTSSDGALSRAQDQPVVSRPPLKVASKEPDLASNGEIGKTPVDYPSRKPNDAQTRTSPQSGTSTEAHAKLSEDRTRAQPQSRQPQAQSQSQPQPQKHSPGPSPNPPPQPSQSKPLSPPIPASKSRPPTQSDPTSDSTPYGSHRRTSSADTSKQYRTLAEEKAQYNAVPPSSRTQYMQMLLALDDIPMIYDLSASFFTWILLAGFILFPGTFTSLQTLELGNGVEAAVVNRIVNLPLFVVAFICTGIGIGGMGYLWWKWMKNYIWLTNKIFMPGLMNSLAGVISTLSNVYGVQHGAFTKSSIITISVTGGVGAVCGILVLFYGVWMLGRVKKRHKREVGVEKAGKHGEGVWAGFKEKIGKVGKRR